MFCFVFLESSDRFAKTLNAFIFSLNNFEELPPFMSKVQNTRKTKAVYWGSNNGPMFGQDLLIFYDPASDRQSLTNFGNSYSVPASVTAKLAAVGWPIGTFSPDEVEVFYLHPSR